jgi:hypothetical protein
MSHSVALPTFVHQQAAEHLLRKDGQEDLCFALWFPSQGQERHTALIHNLIPPQQGERCVHGNASFKPEYFERALGIALREKAGLAFMHSHPVAGWQGMSPDDVHTENDRAAATKAATGFPLVGLTLGTDGAWSARFWERVGPRAYERCWCQTVRVAGEWFSVTYHPDYVPVPRFRPELERTISAWGTEVQAILSRLHVGIVGTGSVGSFVAESLARMGIGRIRLIDFDTIETTNLDRLLHATRQDVFWHQAKVKTLARALKRSATAANFTVDALEWSIVEEEGFRAALDCDILFSCVDNRPWSRCALNLIAYAHLIPVVDGGIFIQTTKSGRLKHAYWRAHVAAPTRPCLECLGQYRAELVAMDRDGLLDNPGYISGLPVDDLLRRNENVFAISTSAASLEILQFLSMIVSPLGISNVGAQLYHFETGRLDIDNVLMCRDGCFFQNNMARGDLSGVNITGQHRIAEQARDQRKHSIRHRVGTWFLDQIARLTQ